MARRPRIFIEGGLYHVTCRGNERRPIFKDDRDRRRFLERLGTSSETSRVRLYLYCLMANHVHLLVETPQGNLDRFMGSLLTGYAVYFNRRHRRAGHLMQGRYGAQVVEDNEYLLKLSRYIHLNPVQVGSIRALSLADRIQYLRRYEWSSYGTYIGRRNPPEWLRTGPVLAQLEAMQGKVSYRRYVEAGIAETDAAFAELMKAGDVAIGSGTFVEGVKKQLLREAESNRKPEDVAFRHLRQVRSADDVERLLATVTGEAWKQRMRRKDGVVVRGVWAWALQHHAGQTQREAAQRLGVGTGAAISAMLRKIRDQDQVRTWRRALELLIKG